MTSVVYFQPESHNIFDDLVVDIRNQLNLLISSTSAHDCLFSPTKVGSTACQYYFLFLGLLSRTVEGRMRLDKHGILKW
jgi:hypothetical protein